MFHFDGYTRGNHPDDAKKATKRRPVRFFDDERKSVFMTLLGELTVMAGSYNNETIKNELYDLLMQAAGELCEINSSDRSTE